ncbi:hypothetical protein A2U10_04140 [Fusobacterium necrophorum subsp. funduliforme]|uniref:Uncharacterized protein n=3 Tax=Fusobacterium necrophorum TaxID=859 RepID=A0A4Q2KYH2_9FUSO|nr:hypothetical protein [Fusobacterium necrophorum]AYV92450.1 hypothetical protein BSQ88_01610 [Fusobacterium necrophorum subsp. funduliforme]AYV94463.1 hypothetical protein BWX37_02025 [Fusobacterium necrophorum subsp. funduliforme]EFS22435.1 hypothetical protein FSEG_00042 [Fusobacterium necrophorum D12]EIJ69804.1 hypothetical protein HMPREF1049_1296 [Fusobacterium necrophorum subsp. funduliforme ATCC 51357]EJU18675.1 hypothetical protein HMPREF1127_1578 [Fusobacterium necrophorum subsp. fun
MKKLWVYMIFVLSSLTLLGESEFGIIQDSELRRVGVSEANLRQAKAVINQAETTYKMLVLERREIELKINKLMMENPAKNLSTLDTLFDRIGVIEAKILKDKVRSQIEMQKYISQEQYLQARELSIQRLNRRK